MKTNIITAGRTDVEEYFILSGIRECKKLNFTPFLVFIPNDNGDIKTEIVYNAKELLSNYQDDIKVMAQWAGKYKSDFFQFSVGQFRDFCKANPKDSYQLV